ncbi:MAG TPA: nuclear transport factor 2 family protein [Solirubrobacterales bacterium]|nr:nuclear transport factor 2 family protein [Solirubrobacterales bacterium]
MSREPTAQSPGERDTVDRLLLRLPVLANFIGAGIDRVRPGSGLRRRLIRLQFGRAFAAMARSDVEVVVLYYEPDAEVWVRGMAGVGISECYRGRDGVRALYADLDEAFDTWSWTIRSVTDAGDQLAVRADFIGVGRGSGVTTTVEDGGTVIERSPRGLVTRQEWFAQQGGGGMAVEAAGLPPQGAAAS